MRRNASPRASRPLLSLSCVPRWAPAVDAARGGRRRGCRTRKTRGYDGSIPKKSSGSRRAIERKQRGQIELRALRGSRLPHSTQLMRPCESGQSPTSCPQQGKSSHRAILCTPRRLASSASCDCAKRLHETIPPAHACQAKSYDAKCRGEEIVIRRVSKRTQCGHTATVSAIQYSQIVTVGRAGRLEAGSVSDLTRYGGWGRDGGCTLPKCRHSPASRLTTYRHCRNVGTWRRGWRWRRSRASRRARRIVQRRRRSWLSRRHHRRHRHVSPTVDPAPKAMSHGRVGGRRRRVVWCGRVGAA